MAQNLLSDKIFHWRNLLRGKIIYDSTDKICLDNNLISEIFPCPNGWKNFNQLANEVSDKSVHMFL